VLNFKGILLGLLFTNIATVEHPSIKHAIWFFPCISHQPIKQLCWR